MGHAPSSSTRGKHRGRGPSSQNTSEKSWRRGGAGRWGGREGGEKEAIQGHLSPGRSLSCYVTSHRRERAKERGGALEILLFCQFLSSASPWVSGAGWEQGEEVLGSKRLKQPK